MLTSEQLVVQIDEFRHATEAPLNVNFFCHVEPQVSRAAARRVEPSALALRRRARCRPCTTRPPVRRRHPFDEDACQLVERCRPEVVSFHFGLPAPELVDRVRCHGCRRDVVGDDRGRGDLAREPRMRCRHRPGSRGRRASWDVPHRRRGRPAWDHGAGASRVVDAVTVPVIAAGGIADGRGVAAALVLGASAVQIGTAYLLCPEALTSPVHRRALAEGTIDDTVLTNVFTGRPARGRRNRLIDELGPMSSVAPAFPTAGIAVAPLRAAAEASRIRRLLATLVRSGRRHGQ